MDLRQEFRRRLDDLTRPWKDSILREVLPPADYARLLAKIQGTEDAYHEFNALYLAMTQGDLEL